MLIEAIVLIGILVLWWKLNDNKRHAGFPPGPLRFPIVGNMPQLATKSRFPAVAMEELSKSYGDIMFVQMGTVPAVVLTSYKAITDLLDHDTAGHTKAPEIIPLIYDRIMHRNLGVIWSNDEAWQTLRRFTIRILRDFGFGKTMSMDFVINEELGKFTAHFDERIAGAENGVLRIVELFDLTIINILWRLVTGVNYQMGDSKMVQLLKISNDMVKATNMGVDLCIAFPFLHKYMGRDEQLKLRDALFDFSRETIREHRESGNYSTDPLCFVDVFLAKIDEMKDSGDTNFTDDQLLLLILDLFQAGAETTSKTLSFGLIYMILNPRLQEKVQHEIDSVVPKDSPITMSFKSRLSYCQATVLEILRVSCVVPFPPLRKSPEDFIFNGYLIKKDTALLLNIQAAHFEKGLWGDPSAFRPERFLTLEGSVDSKIAERILSFGGGKRKCLGYQLAECNLFLYFTSMLRRYQFMKAEGKPEPSSEPILGVTYGPQPFYAKVQLRN